MGAPHTQSKPQVEARTAERGAQYGQRGGREQGPSCESYLLQQVARLGGNLHAGGVEESECLGGEQGPSPAFGQPGGLLGEEPTFAQAGGGLPRTRSLTPAGNPRVEAHAIR